jgi:hypothetical protein
VLSFNAASTAATPPQEKSHMATYPVEIPSERRWGVFHSVSGTMFSPTFQEEDELNAAMFATYYADLRDGDYSENTQARLALDIAIFLDEVAPRSAGQDRFLPLEWQKACDDDWDENDHEEGAQPSFDVYSLLDAFGRDQNSRQARLVMDAFAAWQGARV